ncbi:MAG: hypothetical protein L6R38_008465 [Xanthoria sp. 2 TBL-2021]|nr:MAG: hypothetical protein L6R38_008465 [Xanthoria sp. 2 TBL-2021]
MAELHSNFFAETRPCRSQDKRRPSLYASIRLARFVYHVKERLKCRAQQYLVGRRDIIEIPQLSLHAQARQDLDRLLERLDEQLTDVEPRTSSVATCDHLFLAYNARAVTRFKGIEELRHIYDLTTLLLARLPSSSGDRTRSALLPKQSAPASPRLDHEKFIANLDHILRCLRQAALEALIYHGMKKLREDVRQWHQYWLRDRALDHGWFSEWPGSRRPLSTTWPWNIRPSLVVLWGVCWMFYDNSTRSVEQLRQQLEDRDVASSLWSQPTPQPAPTTSQRKPQRAAEIFAPTDSSAPENITTWIAGAISPKAVPDAPFVWPQDQGSYSLPVPPPNSGSDPSYFLSHRHSAPSIVPTFGSAQYYWDDPQLYEPRHSHKQPRTLSPATRGIASGGPFHPYAPSLQQAFSQGDSPAAAFSPNLRPPMGPMQNYPSPHSDVSKDETRSSNFSILPSNDVSPNMMFAVSPSIASHPSQASPGRRSEEPPRNSSGQITCLHPKCARELPVFGRKCEWTKHMDKHTRPYVCKLPGCEKVRGFTYSGGLSRHQREVHRQNGGPKASYMCPHSDCKRSTGSGFSRKENLQEHLRRVHRHIEDVAVDKKGSQETNIRVSGEPRRRRRRMTDEDNDEAEPMLPEPKKRRREDEDDDDDTEENRNPKEDLSAQVKRLRRELQEKDERLRKLEETVELLTKRNVQPV